MVDRLKLPFAFDPAALQADLDRLSNEGWLPHFNRDRYDGDWSGIVLRGPAGGGDSLYSGGDAFEDRAALGLCPAFQAVLASFPCPLRSVRLLRLGPGAIIREHRDYDLGPDLGEVRLHVPVRTHEAVDFRLRNRRVVMAEGETWYLDLSQPHRVANRSDLDRIHLVIDAVVDDWLRDLIPFDEAPPSSPPREVDPAEACEALTGFRALVAARPDLHAELCDIADRELFAEETVRLGEENGFRFDARTVSDAAAKERRRWNAAWLT